MDRGYVAGIISEYLAEGKPSDSWPQFDDFDVDYGWAYEQAELGIESGYFEAFYDERQVQLHTIRDQSEWADFTNIKLKPTAKAFFYVLGPR